MLTIAITFIFALPMILAAFKDLTSYTIPNWISLWLIAGFFVVTPFVWQGWSDFGLHLLCGFGALIIVMGMFALRWLGGGDAKLFAATALWCLPMELLYYAVYVAVFGGVLTIGIMVVRKSLPVKIATSGWVHRLLRDEKKIPYGLALSAAALVLLPNLSLFKAAALG